MAARVGQCGASGGQCGASVDQCGASGGQYVRWLSYVLSALALVQSVHTHQSKIQAELLNFSSATCFHIHLETWLIQLEYWI